MTKRSQILTGNWKMHKTSEQACAFIKALKPLVVSAGVQTWIAAPFTCLHALKEPGITIGAQNIHDEEYGAFTGEISAAMALDAGAAFVLLGHSERRHIFGESNAFINRKVKRALAAGLQPVLCIGETLEEREAGKTEDVLQKQLDECFADMPQEEIDACVLAYEPVWAIGTGKASSAEDAQKVHAFLRTTVAAALTIQYGGSVKPENAANFMQQPDIDGLLVGGASLSPEIFAKIVNFDQSGVHS